MSLGVLLSLKSSERRHHGRESSSNPGQVADSADTCSMQHACSCSGHVPASVPVGGASVDDVSDAVATVQTT